MSTNAQEIVLSCIRALNDEDYERARDYMHDDFRFVGVLGSRDGADEYYEDMKKMKLHYDVKKAFATGEDVCLLYDLDMSGQTIFGCGWYHVSGDKIDRLQVIFDPRPLLEAQNKP